MAERRRTQVKGYCKIIRRQSLKVPAYDIYHPIYCVGKQPVFGFERTDSVKCAVQNRIAINDKQLFHKLSSSEFTVPFSLSFIVSHFKKNENTNFNFLSKVLTNKKNCVYCLLHRADMAQSAEHILGKDEVAGSIPAISSK